jgi:putative DNA methylase
MSNDDRRLIEDYLPIRAISAEASREKSIRKGHISTLHLWWARRPLVACRAAIYGTLVPADQFEPKNGPPEKRKSLGRANAAKFIERLCKYPGNPQVIKEAEKHILEAHARRLTKETGKEVTREDIEQGSAPRPKVLDMFAGGGSIPLEALRLGCEAYALELNPVAHIIELCTLVYPQKYGKPDPNARGMTGPKNANDEKTWGGLANEVRYWGNWVLEEVRKEIGYLYSPIPDPEYKGKRPEIEFKQGHWIEKGGKPNAIGAWVGANSGPPKGYLTPVAYLWTRTVKCKNPSCSATVPLVKQTWLCRKDGRFIAMRMIPVRNQKRVRFEVVEARSIKSLGFDPAAGSSRGNATCSFCGTVADSDHVKSEGRASRMGQQLMAVCCISQNRAGRLYLSPEQTKGCIPDDELIIDLQKKICKTANLTVPQEPVINDAKNANFCIHYGATTFDKLFSPRQTAAMLAFCKCCRDATFEMEAIYKDSARIKAIASYLGVLVDELARFNSVNALWKADAEAIVHMFGRQTIAVSWDYCENAILGSHGGTWAGRLEYLLAVFEHSLITFSKNTVNSAEVWRSPAQSIPIENGVLDAVITDPPYYDNIPYANLSDIFYVWLKRSIGDLYPEHFASTNTPKKMEAVADAIRHSGDKASAVKDYESMMFECFCEAHRALKAFGQLAIVYAHKTTLGWSTLVDALRHAGYTVTEAWPIDTEQASRMRARDSAALASSIFLVARKRDGSETGSYENDVEPELQRIVSDRVETLWEGGITGADLVIAAVGAGLQALTRFLRVEYANGEEVPAERFLAEVETKVLETILKRLSREVGADRGKFTLAGVDDSTRFYILWRYTYKYSILDAGEAIVFANGTHVELDGPHGLSTGARALLEKKKGKYRLKDYTDRGGDKKLGLMKENGQAAPIIDALHRTLWLMENRPGELSSFLQDAQPNREQMRLVAQALAGPALKGGELVDVSPHAELSALNKLTANWNSVIEGAFLTAREKEAKEAGQISWLK